MRFMKEKKIVDANVKIDLFSLIFSSCLFTGFIPKASGTFGSLFGCLFFFIKGFERTGIILPAIIICFILGIITSKVMIRKYGDDPSVVVIDEVVGMWITILIFNLLTSFENVSLINLIILFLAFRFFDIVKIQPAKYFDKMENAFGIMMDDVIAGIYAGFTVYLITLIFRQI